MLEELSQIGHCLNAEATETTRFLNKLANERKGTTLEELGTRDCGYIGAIEPDEAEVLGAPTGTTNIVAWTIEDPFDDEEPRTTTVRALDQDQTAHVLDRTMSVAIDRLVDYGETHGFETGSPAARIVSLRKNETT